MKNAKLLLAITVIVLVTLVMVIWTAQARAANYQDLVDPKEREEIEGIIKAYFEMRYNSFQVLQLGNFGDIIEKSERGSSFMRSESDKLEVEINHAKLYHLGYSQYKYYLDFKNISINEFTQTATLSVIEGHDVIFQISKELSVDKPVVSKMRNLLHTFFLQKVDGKWKIVSDNYEDFLWRLIKATKITTEGLLKETPPSSKELPNLSNETASVLGNEVGTQDASILCPSLPIDQSTHPYNRDGAIAYAHQWATASPPYNDPPYHDFTSEGGDCTNFVSQAIHEGGSADMVFGGTHGIGVNGWYYYNTSDRAAAWTDVARLYSFITNAFEINLWQSGPEGCDVQQFEAYEGDLIQYNWKVNQQGTPSPNDEIWDHSAIIVQSFDLGYHNRYFYIAAHSSDVDNYPFTSYSYVYPGMVYRFVHIDRIDGYLVYYLPLVANNSELNSQIQNPIQNPYPAPLDYGTHPALSPYPAP